MKFAHKSKSPPASPADGLKSASELALERAVLHSGADIATFQLDLASRMVDSADFFGAMLPDVRSLEQSMLSPE